MGLLVVHIGVVHHPIVIVVEVFFSLKNEVVLQCNLPEMVKLNKILWNVLDLLVRNLQMSDCIS